MKKYLWITLFLSFITIFQNVAESSSTKPVLEDALDVYFKTFVHVTSRDKFDTRVNYKALFKLKQSQNPKYLKLVQDIRSLFASASLDQMSNNQKVALYINAYNFGIIDYIIENYLIKGKPLKSVNDLSPSIFKSVFDLKIIKVAQKNLSLNHIEKKILLGKLTNHLEPRIHFAVICASKGCPILLNEAYRGVKLDEQLEYVTARGLELKRTMDLDRHPKKVYLTKIMSKWYLEDFNHDPLAFIWKHLKSEALRTKLQGRKKIASIDYDWSLNTVEGLLVAPELP